jgi:hypothetical protein
MKENSYQNNMNKYPRPNILIYSILIKRKGERRPYKLQNLKQK